MAVLALPVLLDVALFGGEDIGSFLQAVWADRGNDPWLWVPALLWAALIAFGLFGLIIGGARCSGPFDARLFTSALFKTGLGAVAWFIGFGDRLPKD
jgi:hypothetical protein